MRIVKRGKSEEGIVLLLTLLALLLIAMVVMAMAYMAMNEGSLVANERSSAQAWEAARAGLEQARGELSSRDPASLNQNGGTDYLPQSVASTTGTCSTTPCVTYIINANESSVQPWTTGNSYFDSEFDTEFGVQASSLASSAIQWVYSPTYCMVSGVSSSSCTIDGVNYNASPYGSTLNAAPAWKWVRVTLMTEQSAQEDVDLNGTLDTANPILWNAVNYPNASTQCIPTGSPGCPGMTSSAVLQDQLDVYRLTSYAQLSDGTSSELQEDVVPGAPLPPLPAALSVCAGGPNNDVTFSRNNSSAYSLYGTDLAGSGTNEESIGTCTPASTTTISGAISGTGHGSSRSSEYQGLSSSSDDVVNVGPTTQSGNGSMNACYYNGPCLNNLINSIAAEADQGCGYGTWSSCGSFSNLGTPANPLITVVNGDYTINGGTSGAGILVVTGTLNTKGTPDYSGIILVVGNGNWQTSGGGSGGPVTGGMFVSQLLNESDNNACSPIAAVSGEDELCAESQVSPVSPILGSPTVNMSGGGNANFQYDSTDVKNANHSTSYSVIAFRQITATQ